MKSRGINSIKIENIVASGTVAEAIDLEFIADNISNCTYQKKKFPGAVLHMQDPKSAALIFASGRVVLTGHHNTREIPLALKKLIKNLKENGITCTANPHVKITNVVCTYNIGFPLNLVRIMTALMDHEMVEYEPEAFPGLVCRITDPKLVFLLFSSGKVVITGGKTIRDIRAGVVLLLQKLSIIDNRFAQIEVA